MPPLLPFCRSLPARPKDWSELALIEGQWFLVFQGIAT